MQSIKEQDMRKLQKTFSEFFGSEPVEMRRHSSKIRNRIYFSGFAVIGKAQNQNDFIEPVVEIQTDRGHRIIDTGLYAHIRHPMYSGFLLFFSGMALWHGSIFAFLLVPLILFFLLSLRIKGEEEVLENEFNEYLEYKEKVKAKLIPGIF